jgi:hypothetical protein
MTDPAKAYYTGQISYKFNFLSRQFRDIKSVLKLAEMLTRTVGVINLSQFLHATLIILS